MRGEDGTIDAYDGQVIPLNGRSGMIECNEGEQQSGV